MTILVVTRDLSVISQVDGAAARIGAVAQTVSNGSDAVARCDSDEVTLVILDLSLPSLDVQSLVDQVKVVTATHPRIVAFGSHVHVERLAAAREAGCDEVISRGQFFAQLDAVFRGA